MRSGIPVVLRRSTSCRSRWAICSRRFGAAFLWVLLAPCAAAPAMAQGMGISAGANFDARVLEHAADLSLGDVFARGLVVTYEGDPDRPLAVQFVGLLIQDGRVMRSLVSDAFRLEPGQTAAGSNRMLMSNISKMLGDRAVPADEPFPSDRYVVAERPIGAGQLIPALDGSSKVAGDVLAEAFPRTDRSTQALLVALVPVDRRVLDHSETSPVMVVIRKIGR